MCRSASRLKAWFAALTFGRAALGAADGYVRHATSQLAAAIAYRMLFSLVPLVAFVGSIADLLLPDAQRDAVERWLASVVPGDALDSSIERALSTSDATATLAGLVASRFCFGPRAG